MIGPIFSEESLMVWKYVGGAAGGTLGYIVGDVPGGYAGYKYGRYAGEKFAKRRSMPKSYGKRKRIIGSAVPRKRQRTLQKRRRQLKTKKQLAATKRTLSTRQRTQVRAIAQRVHDGMVPDGTYYKNYCGSHESLAGTVGAGFECDVWTGFQRNGGNISPATGEALGFTPFSGRKLIDAASVLFNGKTPALNHELTTGNFGVGTTTANFKHCSYKLLLKNASFVDYECTLFKFISKETSSTIDLYTLIDNFIHSETWIGGTPSIKELNLNFGAVSKINDKFIMKKQFFRLQPGGQKSFYTQWKGLVDFSKYTDGATTPAVPIISKGLGEYWMFRMVPNLHITNDGTNTRVGRGVTSSTDLNRQILCEVKEVYKLDQPENATVEGEQKKLFNDYPDIDAGTYTNKTNVRIQMPNIYTYQNEA